MVTLEGQPCEKMPLQGHFPPQTLPSSDFTPLSPGLLEPELVTLAPITATHVSTVSKHIAEYSLKTQFH